MTIKKQYLWLYSVVYSNINFFLAQKIFFILLKES